MGYPENDRAFLKEAEHRVNAIRSDVTFDESENEELRELAATIRTLTNGNLSTLYESWVTQKTRTHFRGAMGSQLKAIEAFRRRTEMSKVDEVDVLAKVGFGLDEVPTRKQRVGNFWIEEGAWLRSQLGLTPDSTEDAKSSNSWKLTFWSVTLDHYSLYGIEPLERGATYQLPQFVGKFGSFQTLTSNYGGPKQLRADLEAVKEKLYAPISFTEGDTE